MENRWSICLVSGYNYTNFVLGNTRGKQENCDCDVFLIVDITDITDSLLSRI